jgi:HK97 family phage major capsid protein
MKNLIELKQEYATKVSQMDGLVNLMSDEKRAKSDTEQTLWNTLDKETRALEVSIATLTRQEELNKKTASKTIIEKRDEVVIESLPMQFRKALQEYVTEGRNGSFEIQERANPILSTTDTGIINKVTGDINILYAPGETWLRNLGVTFFEGLTGNYTLPAMGNAMGEFVNEGADASTANMASASDTLAGRRITHSQAITVETLSQSNPTVYTKILENLKQGIWNRIVKDLFQQLKIIAPSQLYTKPSNINQINYLGLLSMEASIGGLLLATPAYVTTPLGKAYLKGTIALGTTAGAPMWNQGEVNGVPAYSVPQIAANELYFGDWSQMAVGTFGPQTISVIVDPLTLAASGQIKLTATAVVDTGVMNPRAFTFCTNASMA